MVHAAADLLLNHPLFARLDGATRRAVSADLVPFGLPGGRTLFKAGEPADALYLVASGGLGVFGGPTTLLRQVGAGMSVGETSLLGGGVRHRTVRALRDSELLRLDRAAFEALLRRHPDLLLQLARDTVAQLQPRVRDERTAGAARTFALLPAGPSVPVRALAMQLARALEPYGSALVLDARMGQARGADWFAEREAQARFVVYLDEARDESWRRRCLRQADVLLPVARANEPARAWSDLAHPAAAGHRPRHLLLVHPGHQPALGSAARWREVFSGRLAHHHICRAGDLARVARLVSGHGRGLVLAGGGARGLAHFGALKALAEAGHGFDAIGGSSIGAIVGAGVAAGWPLEDWQGRCVRSFLHDRLLSDWTFPVVALTRGARATASLRDTFGALAMEDLPLPFFCVATSLSGGGQRVLREGPLWRALRASSAIPGVLPPVLHRGDVLVDGALVNNLPVDVMADDGLGHVTALDIRADVALRAGVDEAFTPPLWRLPWRRGRRPGLVSSLVRAGMVGGDAAAEQRRAWAQRLVTPTLDHIGVLDWKDWQRAVDAGYRATLEALERERSEWRESTALGQ